MGQGCKLIVPLLAVNLLYLVWIAYVFPIYDFDSLIYHLTTPASWYQDGSIGIIPASSSRHLDWWVTYPAGGELLFLIYFLLENHDHLVEIVNIIALAGSYIVIVKTGGFFLKQDEKRIHNIWPHIAGLFYCMIPIIQGQASTAYVDLLFSFIFLCGLYFIVKMYFIRANLKDLIAFILCAGYLLSIKASGFFYLGLFGLFFLILIFKFFFIKEPSAKISFNLPHFKLFANKVYTGKFKILLTLFILIIVGYIGLFFYIRSYILFDNPFHPYQIKVGNEIIFEGKDSWWMGKYGPTEFRRYTTWIDGEYTENWLKSLWDYGSLSRYNQYYASYRGGGGPVLMAFLIPVLAGIIVLSSIYFLYLFVYFPIKYYFEKIIMSLSKYKFKNQFKKGTDNIKIERYQLVAVIFLYACVFAIFWSPTDLFRFLMPAFGILCILCVWFFIKINFIRYFFIPLFIAVLVYNGCILATLNFRKAHHYNKVFKTQKPLEMKDVPRNMKFQIIQKMYPGKWNVAYDNIFMPYELFNHLKNRVYYISAGSYQEWIKKIKEKKIEIYVIGNPYTEKKKKMPIAQKYLNKSKKLFTKVYQNETIAVYQNSSDDVSWKLKKEIERFEKLKIIENQNEGIYNKIKKILKSGKIFLPENNRL
jgi:hypothetical protein